MGKYVKLRYRHRHSNSYQLMFFFRAEHLPTRAFSTDWFLGQNLKPWRLNRKIRDEVAMYGSWIPEDWLFAAPKDLISMKFFFLMSLLNTWNSSPKWSELGNACLLGDMVFPCFLHF